MLSRGSLFAALLMGSSLVAAGDACIPTLSGIYSLNALNTTLPNSSDDGAPIGLTDLFSSQGFITWSVTAANANEFTTIPMWTLVGNGLSARTSNHHIIGYNFWANGPLQMVEDAHDKSSPSPIYCAAPPTGSGKYNTLVTKEVAPTSLWSICPGDRNWPVVVYNATASNWPMDQCYEVEFLLVPLEPSES